MIKVIDLHKKFADLEVLKGISVEVPQGETVAVIGPSGSGKSTFLRCINFLEQPTSGHIYIDSDDLTAPGTNINKVREKLGMVFQQFHLFRHKSVIENLIYAPCKLKNLSQTAAREKAHTLLQRVGVGDKADAYPAQLSGGQQQRVAIARALAMEPEAILFDEPTSSLDPEMVKEVLNVMKSLSHTGMTLMVVTHEMRFAREVADRLLFMDDGQIVEDRAPKEFFADPQSERAKEFLAKML